MSARNVYRCPAGEKRKYYFTNEEMATKLKRAGRRSRNRIGAVSVAPASATFTRSCSAAGLVGAPGPIT
jgi:hypothetical protein